jgi:hypothetical protein
LCQKCRESSPSRHAWKKSRHGGLKVGTDLASVLARQSRFKDLQISSMYGLEQMVAKAIRSSGDQIDLALASVATLD